MNILDLFSGIGGFTIGFHAANYSEYDFRLHYKQQSGKSDGFFNVSGSLKGFFYGKKYNKNKI